MTRVLRVSLIVVAIAALYAACVSIITDTSAYPAAVVFWLALGALVAVDQLEHLRDCRIAAGRRAVWGRRDRRGGRDA
ncbi:hypothetical protein H7I01_06505 [Mycobacterium palustre]|uniref:Uncharacterized protein n=2 Tax=Mycobacterium palustre TaxID=153971 RepID=A0A1X1ZCF7_9MYCO|nr:hypothetical protein [Mycobacterium palustre]MCV7100044.1 hypothetical protein [Mycobacterium palustre]ORW20940.1 hypothetical protein AWC19_14345 [Mycobacterium palustre]